MQCVCMRRRGFVQFVYEPIKTVIECCMADNREKLWKLTDSLGVTPRLKSEDKDLVGAMAFGSGHHCAASAVFSFHQRVVLEH